MVSLRYEIDDGVALGNSVTPGSLHGVSPDARLLPAGAESWPPCERNAAARYGWGEGCTAVRRVSTVRPSAAAEGRTVIPTPDATM